MQPSPVIVQPVIGERLPRSHVPNLFQDQSYLDDKLKKSSRNYTEQNIHHALRERGRGYLRQNIDRYEQKKLHFTGFAKAEPQKREFPK
jgi:hypothetical protein